MRGADVDLSNAVVPLHLYLYGDRSYWRNWSIGVSHFKNKMESESREAGKVRGSLIPRLSCISLQSIGQLPLRLVAAVRMIL